MTHHNGRFLFLSTTMAALTLLTSFPADIPGTDFRLATISGPPSNCARAKEMVEAIVAEVITEEMRYNCVHV